MDHRKPFFFVPLLCTLWAGMLPLDVWSQTDTSGQRPLSGAWALWHMGDLKDSAGNRHLVVHGAVTLGVPLEGADRAASLARGGDGKAARFEGGYLAIAPGDGVLNVPGKAMTIALRCAIRKESGSSQSSAATGASPRPVTTCTAWMAGRSP